MYNTYVVYLYIYMHTENSILSLVKMDQIWIVIILFPIDLVAKVIPFANGLQTIYIRQLEFKKIWFDKGVHAKI